MKKLLIYILSLTTFGYSQTPIVIPTPNSVVVKQSVTVQLSAAQVSSLVAILNSANVKLPSDISGFTFTLNKTGSSGSSSGATVVFRFQ